MPVGECGSERRFVRFCEREDELPQGSTRLSLRPLGEILRHDLDLMELTHLYRNIVENVEESPSSVDHGGLDDPPLLFENGAAIAIVGHELAGDFVPPDVLRERPSTEDADAVLPAPEGGVGDHDGRVWSDFRSRRHDGVESIAHPDVRVSVLPGELPERLFFFDVFLPEFSAHSGIAFR